MQTKNTRRTSHQMRHEMEMQKFRQELMYQEELRRYNENNSHARPVIDITQEVRELNSEDMQECLSAPIAMITGTTSKQD